MLPQSVPNTITIPEPRTFLVLLVNGEQEPVQAHGLKPTEAGGLLFITQYVEDGQLIGRYHVGFAPGYWMRYDEVFMQAEPELAV